MMATWISAGGCCAVQVHAVLHAMLRAVLHVVMLSAVPRAVMVSAVQVRVVSCDAVCCAVL